MISTTPVRRYDLDWLRVLVILTVFIFHCGRFFDMDGWHVKNPVRHEAVQVWTVFLVCWMMPLIFVISGESTFYAFGSRSLGKFLKDRAARLIVPLIVGMFTHVALQVYLERVSFSGFKGTFFDFYPQYFKGFYAHGGNFAWMGLHLWYLEALFLFSLLFIPLFLFLLTRTGQKVIDSCGHWLSKPAALYLLAIPPMALFALLDPKTQWGQRGFGGWPPIIYAFWFLYGFALPMRSEVENQIVKTRRISLWVAVGIFLALVVLWKTGGDPKFGTVRYASLLSLYALASWCFILGFLGLGRSSLSFTNTYVRYANEAVLPFYVLHQTVILSIGFFVVRWSVPDLIKFLAISASSLGLILAIYEFAIRRNNVMRFLFGMRMQPRPTMRGHTYC